MLVMLVLMSMKTSPPPRMFLPLRYVVYSVGKHSLLWISGVDLSYVSVPIITSGLVLSKRFINLRLWNTGTMMDRAIKTIIACKPSDHLVGQRSLRVECRHKPPAF